MALRSHDSATTVRSADRFGDAMRVLSRRPTGHERTVLMPPRARPLGEPALSPSAGSSVVAPRQTRSLAARRLRTLGVLLVTGLALLAAGLLGTQVLLVPAGLVAVLAVLFVVHCRRQAVLAAERARRAAARARRTGAASARPAPQVTGIPQRMPARPLPLPAPLPAPAARYDEPVPVPAALGSSWQPVPVPLPTYVGKATAPRRAPRVLDLTRPGAWTASLEASGPDLDALTEDVADHGELDDILERRRAVGGW